MDSNRIINNSTGKILTVRIPIQYPIKWFNANLGKKPGLSVTIIGKNFEKIRSGLKRDIFGLDMNLDMVNTYLYLFAAKVTGKLDADWTSYGRTIGSKNDTISPLSLIDLRSTEQTRAFQEAESCEQDEAWMALYVLSIYRMIQTKPENRSSIATKINLQLRALNTKAADITDVVDLYRPWEHNRMFNILVAAYDMFFHKFPYHKWANIRIATIGSRSRNCAGLLSIGYICDVLGLNKPVDLLDWIWVDQIGNCFKRMMPVDEELNKVDSYFPYQVDLGLVSNSAFSASANSEFFEWVHLIGCLLGQTRSINARHICEYQTMKILFNAACVAYTYEHDISKVSSPSGTVPQSTESQALKLKDLMLKFSGSQMTEKVKEYVRQKGRMFKETKPGTVYEHLKTLALSL